MGITLTKKSEDANTITLQWTPVAGCTGYRFTAEKQPKPSHTWNANQSTVKFAKGSAWYRVEALGVEDAGTYPSAEPPPPGEPVPIAGQGYTKVFEDNFTSLDTNVWRLANWYSPEEPSDVFVSNGVMNVVSRQSEGNPARGAMTKGNYAWQYGYFETRMRWTANVNAFPAFWMMSKNWIDTGNCQSIKISEFDIFEAFDVGYPYNHSGALHQNTTGACGQADGLQQVYTTDVRTKGVIGQLPGNWHVYSGLWTPTTVSWYVDDHLLGSRPTFATSNQPMRLFLQMASHGSAGIDLVSEYEWVRVWQK